MISRFKIPTLLGLAVIIIGIAVGVVLVLKDQPFLTKASPNITPQNITVTNIEDSTVVVSFQTTSEVTSFITFGKSQPSEQTILDDRDEGSPKPHKIHYFTLKNLQPQTPYQAKIISSKYSYDLKFTTAQPTDKQNGFGPIIGTILDEDKSVDEAIAYLSISSATIQSALIKNLGNFLIPVSLMRKDDLSSVFPLTEDTVGKLTVVAPAGNVAVLFKLKSQGTTLPPLKLGQNIDLTEEQEETTPKPSPTITNLNEYDLNGDGKINALDNAIVLQNFGKNPKNRKADLNRDGAVDQKDLEEMALKINTLGTP